MLGPVFRFELIMTARRKRYYVARVAYGLFLLFSLATRYGEGDWSRYATMNATGNTIDEVNRFSSEMFTTITWAQGVALVCLLPALLAGVIADEAQRKTLHYLLASRMSSAEIVLGKLCARLLHVGVIVLMGIPVVCLLALYGSLDPWEVTYIYAGTGSLVLFVAGLSLLVSVLARRPREAILLAFVLVFLWLTLPLVLEQYVQNMAWPLTWVGPVNDFLLLMNPGYVWRYVTGWRYMYVPQQGALPLWLFRYSTNEILHRFLCMAVLQTGFGLLFLALAIAGLRPLRGREGRQTLKKERGRLVAAIASALRTATKRPPCDDDDPMLWKERFAAGGGFTWLRSRPMALFLGVLLGCYLFDAASPAFEALTGLRWGATRNEFNARIVLNGGLRQTSTFLFVLTLLSVASAAAVSMTSEREQDTWLSLSGTLLSSREIVLGKIRGAVWSSKRLILALLIMWSVGLLAGAIFPLGVLAALGGLFVFCRFTAALGVWFSLRAKNSPRALFATILCLLILNGGYLVLVPSAALARSDVLSAGVMPYMEWLSLVSYNDVSGLFWNGRFKVEGYVGTHGLDTLAAYLCALFGYGVGAMILSGATIEAFPRTVDRPRRNPGRRVLTAPVPPATILPNGR